jgi:hypothetical protein
MIAAENDPGFPVVHPVAARVWYVQKLLRVKNRLKGASRLLGGITVESLTVPDPAGNRDQLGEQTTWLVSQ